MTDRKDLKVAIVHDWLVGGGAELVVLELHKMFPDAPIYTSYSTDEWREKLDNKVVTGFLQRWPFGKLRKYLPLLRIWWFTRLDFSDYDLVISSSGNGEAKGIRVPKTTTHVCYCHSPTHFYWRHYDQYRKHPGFGPFAGIALKLLVGPLRKWDLKASRRPDYFIANSTHIGRDIKRYYNRDSVVVHPPVNQHRFRIHQKARHGFVTVGRQVPYKKVDLIVRACNNLGLDLTVIGKGPDHEKLKKLAGPTVRIAGHLSDSEVEKLMSESEAFIIAAFEDFGITPIEAMMCGTPVIAFEAGGALDYVVEAKTGAFFDKQTVTSLQKTLSTFTNSSFDPKSIRRVAETFSEEAFRKNMADVLDTVIEKDGL